MCETAAQEHKAGREEKKLIPSLTHLHHKLYDFLQSMEAVLRKEGEGKGGKGRRGRRGGREGGREGREDEEGGGGEGRWWGRVCERTVGCVRGRW